MFFWKRIPFSVFSEDIGELFPFDNLVLLLLNEPQSKRTLLELLPISSIKTESTR
jgi:hypothetical protein